MSKKIWLVPACMLAMVLFNGCKTDTKIIDELRNEINELKNRVAALEKMLMPPKEEPVVQTVPYEVPDLDSPLLGNNDAKVSVVIFSNFQCQFCARADKALRAVVGDPELKDKVKVVFKHFPFDRHSEARPASKVAMAAGEQNKFWEMTEKIFSNQGEMNEQNYQKWAKELKLNVDKFNKDRKDNDKKYNDLIDRDIKMGSENAKLEGTPWILVGGWLLDGEISPATVKKMIEEKKLLNKETPPA